MSDQGPPRAHPDCHGPAGHVCQKPSGRHCLVCSEPAGTLWGPNFCPRCDMERLDRITRQLEALANPATWS